MTPHLRSHFWSLAFVLGVAALVNGCAGLSTQTSKTSSTLTIHLRSLKPGFLGGTSRVERTEKWDPKRTAIIVCDMWDDHWCRSAAARVGELLEPINRTLDSARKRGVFIIHAPSSVSSFYNGTPARELARRAPHAPTPLPLSKEDRWGTHWAWIDGTREGVLPIDDSDMGCSCTETKCTIRSAWTRQHPGLRIEKGDALTDDGQETWNLLEERGIDHVILCGVHLNMCVLGRPFAIREMVKQGKHVALLRDLTDTMYNPDRPPGVDHFTGTDLMVAHVERFWCPSLKSSDLTGAPAFRFKHDRR